MNYYSEWDTHAAGWLSNLCEAGLIPPGKVDQRDIREVKADEVRGYTQCHYFAGIGGWPRALDLAGASASRSLWTASLPCQPFSIAGQRKGEEDERHLWPVFFRLVCECLPPVLLGEQVASDDGLRWLSGVRADLETAGYAVGAACLPAACQGAPHQRHRIFWGAVRVSDTSSVGREDRGDAREDGGTGGRSAPGSDRPPVRLSDVRGKRRDGGQGVGRGGRLQAERGEATDNSRDGGEPVRLANDNSERRQGEGCPRPGRGREPVRGSETGRLADTDGGQSGDGNLQRGGEHGQQPEDGGVARGVFHPASNGRQGGDAGIAHDAAAGSGRKSQPVGAGGDADGMEYAGGAGREGGEYASPGCPQPGEARGSTGQPGGSPADLRAWDRFGVVQCRDGKPRRVPESVLLGLADGIQRELARLLAAIVADAKQEVIHYGIQIGQDERQVMSVLWDCFQSETVLQRGVGVRIQLPPQEVLLSFLRYLASACDGAANNSGRQEASPEVSAGALRGVWLQLSDIRASSRRRAEEQRHGQSADALLELSLFLARCAESFQQATAFANAATVSVRSGVVPDGWLPPGMAGLPARAGYPLTGKFPGRGGTLRGLGNAIVPQVAAHFIRAFLEAVGDMKGGGE